MISLIKFLGKCVSHRVFDVPQGNAFSLPCSPTLLVISFHGNPQNLHSTDELRNLEEQRLEEKLKLEGLCFWRSRENWELEAICIWSWVIMYVRAEQQGEENR